MLPLHQKMVRCHKSFSLCPPQKKSLFFKEERKKPSVYVKTLFIKKCIELQLYRLLLV